MLWLIQKKSANVIYEWSPRVLCSTNDCAICRQDMPQIVFSSKVAKFKDLADRVLPKDKRYQICFEDDSLKKSFEELLNHSCPICPNKPTFRTFKQLDTHVRREHERFYCELCTTDLKVNTRAFFLFNCPKCLQIEYKVSKMRGHGSQWISLAVQLVAPKRLLGF